MFCFIINDISLGLRSKNFRLQCRLSHRLINVKALISSRYIAKFELWKILEKIY